MSVATAPAPVPTAPLAHKTDAAECYVSSWDRAGDSFVVRADWPQAHSFYAPNGTHFETTLLLETFRQAGYLYCHEALGVPTDEVFLLQDLSVSADAEGLRTAGADTQIVVHVRAEGVRRRREQVGAAQLHYIAYRDGQPIGTGTTSVTCVPRSTYARLRRNRPAGPVPAPGVPVPPSTVGRSRPEDVVLSAGEGDRDWQLRVDQAHPVLFDHPLCHVPGMLLVEAMRQAGQQLTGAAGGRVDGIETRFLTYAELDAPVRLEALEPLPLPDGRAVVELALVQQGRVVATGTVSLRTRVD